MKRFAGVIVVAILAGAGCWFFGLGLVPAIVVVLVVGSLGVVLRVLTAPATVGEWPAAPPQPTDGARRETSELSWALRTRGGIVDDAIILRVRAIVANRLAHRQLDLDNPGHRRAIEKLIGAGVYELVSASGNRQRVKMPSIVTTLDILERLDVLDKPDRVDPPIPR
ncbi:MAG: hypothetical protein QOH77_856 [Actinomycetota bacterium]|jgi:hypothetical protein|nr:hypothetical protein [Actinomycetota bacterium]MDQ1563997.1 hypothetical protein [Actinomycetota bacterium]